MIKIFVEGMYADIFSKTSKDYNEDEKILIEYDIPYTIDNGEIILNWKTFKFFNYIHSSDLSEIIKKSKILNDLDWLLVINGYDLYLGHKFLISFLNANLDEKQFEYLEENYFKL